jgi:Uma2 family endonuclease
MASAVSSLVVASAGAWIHARVVACWRWLHGTISGEAACTRRTAMTDVLQPSSTPGSSTTPAARQPASGSSTIGDASTWPAGIPTHMTWDEYLAWDFEDCQAEWVDGEVILMPPVRLDHQFVAGFLYRLIIAFVERHHLGAVLQPPTRMRLSSRPSGREPDVLFVATAHADRLKETYVDGPADLAVEVVSPESEERDRSIKFVEYESGGVPEYWLLDPIRKEAYFYLLGPDGRYHLAPISDGVYRSHVLEGFRLRVDWHWRVPLPTPEEALAELTP